MMPLDAFHGLALAAWGAAVMSVILGTVRWFKHALVPLPEIVAFVASLTTTVVLLAVVRMM